MCFSASASFGISAVLLGGGIATIKKVQHPSQLPFAAIPIIFSLQQFTEGFVWLGLTNPAWAGHLHWATYAFLIFAQVVWPIWVPLSIRMMEEEAKRKKILDIFLVLGTMVGIYLAYCLFTFPVKPVVDSHHIHYDLDFPNYYLPFSAMFYFIPTVVSPFISSAKKMPVLGAVLLASFIVSKLFFQGNVISVWCFFAAVLSITVYIVVSARPVSNPQL
jgi:hypothetical protein